MFPYNIISKTQLAAFKRKYVTEVENTPVVLDVFKQLGVVLNTSDKMALLNVEYPYKADNVLHIEYLSSGTSECILLKTKLKERIVFKRKVSKNIIKGKSIFKETLTIHQYTNDDLKLLLEAFSKVA